MTSAPHPLLATAHALADGLLAPQAARVDQEGVPVSHIEAIRRSGLLGMSAPVEYGGAGAPDAVAREVQEILAGACGIGNVASLVTRGVLLDLVRADPAPHAGQDARAVRPAGSGAAVAPAGER